MLLGVSLAGISQFQRRKIAFEHGIPLGKWGTSSGASDLGLLFFMEPDAKHRISGLPENRARIQFAPRFKLPEFRSLGSSHPPSY